MKLKKEVKPPQHSARQSAPIAYFAPASSDTWVHTGLNRPQQLKSKTCSVSYLERPSSTRSLRRQIRRIRNHVSETLLDPVSRRSRHAEDPQEYAKWQIHRRQVLFSATRSVLRQPLVIPCPITHSHVRSPLKRSCSNSNSFITQLLFKCAVRHSNFEFECSLTSQSHVAL